MPHNTREQIHLVVNIWGSAWAGSHRDGPVTAEAKVVGKKLHVGKKLLLVFQSVSLSPLQNVTYNYNQILLQMECKSVFPLV